MMPFLRVEGRAAPMPAPDIDTDVIMPKQFLKRTDREGLAIGVFHHLRFRGDGTEEPGFVLNQPGWRSPAFLVTGPNFGCGSSREHAVWGLAQLGVRALLGTSFAGIFHDNCLRNGLLPARLSRPIGKGCAPLPRLRRATRWPCACPTSA
jgi:3-isopropylmalate/(R)-2-methylmalate dehydratase small subunit